ncbi:MAG TPA: hypothetical protein VHJ82_02950 [Actinomycetota bacterium]|nr:hypothetical protein [Actinomycetota bacterium]
MVWRWIYRDSAGEERGSSESFDSKEQAEEWMGENWSELLEAGTESVTLRSDDESLYDMGLRAE